jgi:transposase
VLDTEVLPKCKVDGVRRVEVFTGAGRRRAWTAEQKARIIAESREGGETVSAIARRHGLTPQQLFGWRRQVRQQSEREAGENGAAFTPVVVEPCRAQPDAPIASAVSNGYVIEIVVGTATVRVLPGIDPMTLTMVLRAVRAAT